MTAGAGAGAAPRRPPPVTRPPTRRPPTRRRPTTRLRRAAWAARATRAGAGRSPDLSTQPLDDLVVPFVGPDQPVPLAGDARVGIGRGAGADYSGGPEHPHDRRVLLGEPPPGDLGPVHEPVLVLHAPESPRLDGFAQLGVRPRIAEGDLGIGLLGQRNPGPEQPLVVLDQQIAPAADARGGHDGENLGDVGVDRRGAGRHRDRDPVMAVLHEVQVADAIHVDGRDRLAAPPGPGEPPPPPPYPSRGGPGPAGRSPAPRGRGGAAGGGGGAPARGGAGRGGGGAGPGPPPRAGGGGAGGGPPAGRGGGGPPRAGGRGPRRRGAGGRGVNGFAPPL